MSTHYKSPRKLPRRNENEWNIVDGSKIYIATWDYDNFQIKDISSGECWEFRSDRKLTGSDIVRKLTSENKVS